jgi:hypothetical protein
MFQRDADGMFEAVLVLGNGVHLEAAARTGSRRWDPWNTIFRRIWREIGSTAYRYDRLPDSPSIRWSATVRAVAESTGADLEAAETDLRQRVCDALRGVEERQRSGDFYARILSGRFRHVLSFPIDRRLSRHASGHGIESEDWVERASGFLGRRAVVTHEGELRTLVWYPYGDTLDPQSLRIGVDQHPRTLMLFEDLRSPLMNEWRAGDSLWDPSEFYRWRRDRIRTWYDLFFLAPMVFVGTRLCPDDWPLWWMLHQRARNLVPFDEKRCPPAFVLGTPDDRLEHLRDRPANLELVLFDDYTGLWDFLLDAIK